jgi:hypothetical protein
MPTDSHLMTSSAGSRHRRWHARRRGASRCRCKKEDSLWTHCEQRSTVSVDHGEERRLRRLARLAGSSSPMRSPSSGCGSERFGPPPSSGFRISGTLDAPSAGVRNTCLCPEGHSVPSASRRTESDAAHTMALDGDLCWAPWPVADCGARLVITHAKGRSGRVRPPPLSQS